jgi:hypothetical protein
VSEPDELHFRAFVLEHSSDRAELIASIERALAQVNAQLGSTFAHDGNETEGDVVYTVWTDDPEGPTVTSWIRLTDDETKGALVLEINATTAAILEAASAVFVTSTPVVQRIDRATRPF